MSYKGAIRKETTYEEAVVNIKDAIQLHIEDRIDAGEEIPQPETVSLTLMDVAVN